MGDFQSASPLKSCGITYFGMFTFKTDCDALWEIAVLPPISYPLVLEGEWQLRRRILHLNYNHIVLSPNSITVGQ